MASVEEQLSQEGREYLRQMGGRRESRQPRTFYLRRIKDVNGVSGTGKVAEGVEFSDGSVSMRWCSDTPTFINAEGGIDWIVKIHGHGGSTEVVWLDQE